PRRRVVDLVDLLLELGEIARSRLLLEANLVGHRPLLSSGPARPLRSARRDGGPLDRGYPLAPLQRLQEADRARRGVLGVQRLHLQPEAHRALLLQRELLGGASAWREPPRVVGRREARTEDGRRGDRASRRRRGWSQAPGAEHGP